MPLILLASLVILLSSLGLALGQILFLFLMPIGVGLLIYGLLQRTEETRTNCAELENDLEVLEKALHHASLSLTKATCLPFFNSLVRLIKGYGFEDGARIGCHAKIIREGAKLSFELHLPLKDEKRSLRIDITGIARGRTRTVFISDAELIAEISEHIRYWSMDEQQLAGKPSASS